MQILQARKSQFNPYQYHRRSTREVMVGPVGVGGKNPIRIQSMTITSTMDTQATIDQTKKLAEAGCEIVRITTPTIKEARNLENIKNGLLKIGCQVPLVADIHFNPAAAMIAADFVEKVRINPGNFVDGKAFKTREYTDEQYLSELNRIEDKFTPLVLKLKKLKRALRIGTNHGSLSDRIMNRFGDTPLGMVESALEYTRVARKNNFHDIIFSMKASNPRVMIAAYRMLCERLDEEGWDYPLHLGVTEAGDGEDGRIKSAIGIGSLLEDGLGDTIRVSLTEDPEYEIPVAQQIASYYQSVQSNPHESKNSYVSHRIQPERRFSHLIHSGSHTIGGSSPIRVAMSLELGLPSSKNLLSLLEDRLKQDTPPEIIEIPYEKEIFKTYYNQFLTDIKKETSRLTIWVSFKSRMVPMPINIEADGYVYTVEKNWADADKKELVRVCQAKRVPLIIRSHSVELLLAFLEEVMDPKLNVIIGLDGDLSTSHVHIVRSLVAELKDRSYPLILTSNHQQANLQDAIVQGSLICDGIGDIVLMSQGSLSHQDIQFSYNFLQGCGSRLTKTEFVSCPSCGRTLFDLQTTTERIKSKTGHLKGVKIAIMGCIVNGPGEMADADFGYVGGGPGKINLYVGKTCVEKSIPSDEADERLIDLIKKHGKWVNPLEI